MRRRSKRRCGVSCCSLSGTQGAAAQLQLSPPHCGRRTGAAEPECCLQCIMGAAFMVRPSGRTQFGAKFRIYPNITPPEPASPSPAPIPHSPPLLEIKNRLCQSSSRGEGLDFSACQTAGPVIALTHACRCGNWAKNAVALLPKASAEQNWECVQGLP